jgi:NAD(P)-dependent dehydrogenase (short-subunit alcohol dehydrogenase family)
MTLPVRATLGRLAGALVDPTVVWSFDRTGYRIHALRFDPADLDVDLRGRTALVTGANSGIGFATARGLARRGAEVWMLCRNAERAERAADAIRREAGAERARVVLVDVSETASVRRAAEAIDRDRIDLLVHNAGLLVDARQETSEGVELTFATHVVGPFLLTALLEPRLRAASQARVVFVSSGGMYTQRLQTTDPLWTERPFDGVRAYAEAKRAQVVLAELFARRLHDGAVTVNAMHPGWADTPGVESSLPGFHTVMRLLLRTPEEGADTVLWLCTAPGLAGVSGGFFFDRERRRTHWLPWTRESEDDRRALWRLCTGLAGLPPQTWPPPAA